ncbi:Protein tyrosine kinase [Rhizoctonia solani]|uniref:Protein tyrosine kinase n=1 Tax=Rhizoctonia solani TaxID=456999 RepID=A0A8H7H8N9_9AGAM|nr:Protein tyrosine kinase [Rhizoctonia solani]
MHSVSHGLHTLDKDHAIHCEPIIVQHDMALPNYHHSHPHHPPNPRPQPPRQTQTHTCLAIPGIALSPEGDRLIVGDSTTSSHRSWTTLKNVGDGSFGSVWLCDWHSPLPPNTPLSPMQRGPKVRPEWVGRRLVALKCMKRQWKGGWDECKTLKEIESLRSMPMHPNIIPLYDCFVLPTTQELYLVFESMEGNLYQLIKSRKGKKALAGGLVTSIFQQVASALDHVHSNGYFHRDMKPENLLVTTTGLANYVSTSPLTPNAREEDVFVIIKLADFGLARETASRPPYTEYVSTRWYRAPEVLLRSRDYSGPVDMWAFGTIMAELLNLLPLFPGSGEMDQLKRINDILGDPSDAYGFDENGRRRGGGPWPRGYELGKPLGYQFPRNYPTPLAQCFSKNVPRSLIECIEDLLRYDPAERLTAKQCLVHPFLAETAPRQPQPPPLHQRVAPPSTHRLPSPRGPEDRDAYTGIPAVSPRAIPPNHAMSPPSQRPPFPNPQTFQNSNASSASFPNPSTSSLYNATSGASTSSFTNPMPPPARPLYHRERSHSTSNSSSFGPHMEIVDHSTREADLPNVPGSLEAYSGEDSTEWHKGGSYQLEQRHQQPNGRSPYPMDISDSQPNGSQHGYNMDVTMSSVSVASKTNSASSGKRGVFGLRKLTSGLFGHSEKLPAVAEVNIGPSGSQTSLKRTQSNSTTDGKSIKDKDVAMAAPPAAAAPPVDRHDTKKQRKLEALEKRKLQEERMRARSRVVLAKREMMLNNNGGDFAPEDWTDPMKVNGKGKPAVKVPIMPTTYPNSSQLLSPPGGLEPPPAIGGWREPGWRDSMDDDQQSIASSDRRRLSMATVATVDSDPGPVRTGRQRGASIGINRATSVSSLRAAASGGGYPRSARSSASFEQFTAEFNSRATMAEDPSSPRLRLGSLSPGPGGHGHPQGHWGNGQELPQLVLNGQAGGRRMPGMSSFASAMSPTASDSMRGSMSPGSPYDSVALSPPPGVRNGPPGMYNHLPSLFNHDGRQPQTLPPFSELVAPLEQR